MTRAPTSADSISRPTATSTPTCAGRRDPGLRRQRRPVGIARRLERLQPFQHLGRHPQASERQSPDQSETAEGRERHQNQADGDRQPARHLPAAPRPLPGEGAALLGQPRQSDQAREKLHRLQTGQSDREDGLPRGPDPPRGPGDARLLTQPHGEAEIGVTSGGGRFTSNRRLAIGPRRPVGPTARIGYLWVLLSIKAYFPADLCLSGVETLAYLSCRYVQIVSKKKARFVARRADADYALPQAEAGAGTLGRGRRRAPVRAAAESDGRARRGTRLQRRLRGDTD